MSASVIQLLRAQAGYLSGEEMSQALGVSRAAIWKQIQKLREQGYEIDAVTSLGYRLISEPDTLELPRILSFLGPHPWAEMIAVRYSVDSTNTQIKRLAEAGAPAGTVLLSEEQTGGRGRQGRSFLSVRGKGVYLSALLRPHCAPAAVSHVTAMAAVAACDAVESVTGLRPGIKWTNDLVVDRKKLAGILTEMSIEGESGALQYLVIGIGINVNYAPDDFPPQLQTVATSLSQKLGTNVNRSQMAAALIRSLSQVSTGIETQKAAYLKRYAADCITVGKEIQVIRGSAVRRGRADGIGENGALLVTYEDGTQEAVASGEVSVRGMYGYL